MRKLHSKSRAGKLAGRLLFLLLGLVLLVFLAPTIIAKTDLRNWAIGKLLPQHLIKASTGGASLGWFSASEIQDLKLDDRHGLPLLTAARIHMDRTPVEILGNRNQLGVVTIDAPTLFLRVGPNGSNLEEIIQALSTPNANAAPEDTQHPQQMPQSPIPNLAVRINGGKIFVEDLVSSQVWRTDNVTADFNTSTLAQGLVQLAASGQVVPGNTAPTNIPVVNSEGALGPGGFMFTMATGDDGRQQAKLRVSAFPLESLTAWLRRMINAPELHGVLTAESASAWKPLVDTNSGQVLPTGFTSVGYLVVEQLDASATALSGDHIRLAQVDMPWRISAQGPAIVLEELALRGDLGELSAKGSLNTLALEGAASPEMLSQQDLQIRGNLDLAKLAAMLPQALSIREDTRITSGGLQLLVENRPHDNGVRLVGSLKTDQLAANSAGKPLRWDQPIRVDFDTIWQQDQFQIESLACESSFCRVTAKGNDRDLRANAEFDLDRLAAELSQFVDLSDWRPAGSGTAELLWQKTPNRRFVADGAFRLQDFVLQSQGRSVWAEPRLAIAIKAGGALDEIGLQPSQVDQGNVTLRAGGDSLDATLQSIVDLRTPQPAWPIELNASGDAGRWLARLQPFMDTRDWQASGKVNLAAHLVSSASLTEVSNTEVRITNLRAQSQDWKIEEPRIELSGDMRWDGANRLFLSNRSQFICSSMSLESRDVKLAMPAGAMPQVLGVAAVRADLARIAAMRNASDWNSTGMVAGNLSFAGNGDKMSADLDLQGSNLSLRRRVATGQAEPSPVWSEPQLTITGRASLLAGTPGSSQRITLDQFRVNSQTLAMMASGSIDQLATTRDVNLQGTVDYDLAQLTPLLVPFMGPGLQLEGRKQARFEIVGPLATVASGSTNRLASSANVPAPSDVHWSQTLQGNLQAPWDSAGLFGLPIGPGQISAKLATGGIQFDPLQVTVGKGQLDIQPFVKLDPEPSQLMLPKGQALKNVDISREVSDAMLKYIAPVLADATRSQGVFTMNLDGGRVPLDDPQQADIAGQLMIHNVDVLPGPSTEKWVGIAQQIEDLIKNRNPQALVNRPPKTILRIHDRTVPFRLAQGRVYHDQLEFNVGEVIVRSQGSVGLDESLSLNLSVPFQDKWIESTPFLSGLRGQSVQIPVGGTLSSPQIDSRAVTSLSTQLLRSAAQEALGGQLNRALEGIFGRPRQDEQ